MMEEVVALSKQEFLEILRDYLKKDFSDDEVNDIIRDYEEYFVDGIIEGKSDMEIISQLGSPKTISEEFVSQIKGDKISEDNDQIVNKRVLNSKISDAKHKTGRGIKQIGTKISDFFKKSQKWFTELLTLNIEKERKRNSGGISRALVFSTLIILTMFMLLPFGSLILFILSTLAGLVASAITSIIMIPFVFKFIGIIPDTWLVFVFGYVAFVGFQILAWQIVLFVVTFSKGLVRKYIHWIKTRGIYIRASKKKDIRYKSVDLSKGDGERE
jgi:hypothetical protein